MDEGDIPALTVQFAWCGLCVGIAGVFGLLGLTLLMQFLIMLAGLWLYPTVPTLMVNSVYSVLEALGLWKPPTDIEIIEKEIREVLEDTWTQF